MRQPRMKLRLDQGQMTLQWQGSKARTRQVLYGIAHSGRYER